MIITIGSDGSSLTSPVAKRFGHANYYLMYNTVDKTYEAIENTDEDHSHSLLYKLAEKGTEIYIVANIGPHAFEIASESCKVFLARKMTVEETVKNFEDGNLLELKEPTVKKSIKHK